MIGVISIRHRLTYKLKFRGGNITYYIRISERNKGYATKILPLALKYCKELYIDEVLITCSKDNIYSVKTILNNGGIFDSKDFFNE